MSTPSKLKLVSRAATTAGHALTYTFNRKMTQAGEACRLAGLVFIPLPMEILFGWHKKTVEQVRKIGSALARHTGQEESEAICHLGQSFKCLIFKCLSIFQNQMNIQISANITI